MHNNDFVSLFLLPLFPLVGYPAIVFYSFLYFIFLEHCIALKFSYCLSLRFSSFLCFRFYCDFSIAHALSLTFFDVSHMFPSLSFNCTLAFERGARCGARHSCLFGLVRNINPNSRKSSLWGIALCGMRSSCLVPNINIYFAVG